MSYPASNTWDLTNIISKVRATTGRPDEAQLTDTQITNYINLYYQYVMPKELKIFFQYEYYTFFTTANQDVYDWPVAFATTNPVAYADGFPMDWYTNPDLFFQDFPQQDNKVVVATGNGTTNSFSFQISDFPVLIGSVYVTDGTQVAQFLANGNFDPDSNATAGVINYTTGTVTGLAFTTAPANNTNITCTFATFQASRPQAILYFNNTYTLRLPPDQVYEIKMEGLPIPKALTNPTSEPFRKDLGPLIAYGASLEIFYDFNQNDQADQTMPQYNRYKDIAMQDTYEVYLYQRSVPAY